MDRDLMTITKDLVPLSGAAKLILPNLLPQVQCLTFSDDCGSQDTVLMELTEDMVHQLQDGSTYVLRVD